VTVEGRPVQVTSYELRDPPPIQPATIQDSYRRTTTGSHFVPNNARDCAASTPSISRIGLLLVCYTKLTRSMASLSRRPLSKVMAMRRVMALLLGIAIMAMIVVGLIHSELMVELSVKLLAGMLFAGVPVAISRALVAR